MRRYRCDDCRHLLHRLNGETDSVATAAALFVAAGFGVLVAFRQQHALVLRNGIPELKQDVWIQIREITKHNVRLIDFLADLIDDDFPSDCQACPGCNTDLASCINLVNRG